MTVTEPAAEDAREKEGYARNDLSVVIGPPLQLSPWNKLQIDRGPSQAIRGSERSAGTRAPDHERGGAMYDRRSRQPITLQRLITPRLIEAGWSAISSSLRCRSLRLPVDYSTYATKNTLDRHCPVNVSLDFLC